MPHKKLSDCPDLFVYLCKDDDGNKLKNYVSYIRLKVTDISNVNAKAEYHTFKPEPSNKRIHKVRDNEAGIFKFRICIQKANTWKDKQIGGWNKNVNIPQELWSELRVNIYQAKDVLSADKSGTSDPFVKIYFYGQQFQTRTIKKSLNPIWLEKIIMPAKLEPGLGNPPPVYLTLWDEDVNILGGKSADLLGSC